MILMVQILPNVYENQIVPVGVHKLSKSFRPNMATILVLFPGSKFIPKWRDANLKFTFKKFEDKVITKQNVFLETAPVLFVLKQALQNYKLVTEQKSTSTQIKILGQQMQINLT